jgi:hypothetical protein
VNGWAEVNKNKTHCPAGHELAGTNLLKSLEGFRNCRTCHNEAQKRYKLRQKELEYE